MITQTEQRIGAEAYARKKESERLRQAEKARQGQELGEIPAPANKERRELCRVSLLDFLETYFKKDFVYAWSQDHLTLIDEAQKRITNGGLKAIAMPRATGKTTICERAAIWAVLYGYQKYVALIGSNGDAASELLQSIKTEIETNDIIAEDFPEVCIPIRHVATAPQKQKGQTLGGERTRIEWSGRKKVVFPTILGSPSSGSVIQCSGILGRVRGMKHVTEDGTIRPSICLIDDPQTDSSARTDSQVSKRMRVMTGAILGLAGPGVKMAALAPVTVIRVNDMADQILDKDAHPEWDGLRTKLLYGEAKHKDLLEIYWDLRAEEMRQTGGGPLPQTTEFYLENQDKIEAGFQAAWPERKNDDEISAIQHCLNLIQDRGKDVFDAEFQNDPQAENSGDEWHLPQDKIVAKINGLDRRVVPLWATKLTAFCDIQQRLLYWMVCAFGDNGRGAIIDYGAWPEQKQAEFNYHDIRNTLGKKYAKRGIKGAIMAGLEDLVVHLVERDWLKEDRTPTRITAMGIDSGNWTKDVHEFVRTSKHAGILYPTKGKGMGADRKPISEWAKKPNEQIGEEWILAPQPKHASRLITYDTNYYKHQLFLKLSTPLGEPEDLSLWGHDPKFTHRMVAAHFHAETFVKTESDRTVYVFSDKPSRPDNHLLDCAVGCLVLRLNGLVKRVAKKRKATRQATYF